MSEGLVLRAQTCVASIARSLRLKKRSGRLRLDDISSFSDSVHSIELPLVCPKTTELGTSRLGRSDVSAMHGPVARSMYLFQMPCNLVGLEANIDGRNAICDIVQQVILPRKINTSYSKVH